ncbi:MAG TPA: c-type cytochrome domain-containing protein [Tepidisphaeraceae bacterium]|jgi:hypothetical protein
MRKHSFLILGSCVLGLATSSARAADSAAPKITYQDHVLPIFRNNCLNCHNPDKKKGSLDLSTYVGVSTGGGSGKAIEPGDPDSSKLFKAVSWAEEPNMPPKGDKLSDKDLKVIREWIAGGAPETSGSKVVINKPRNNLAVVATTAGKPEGPVAIPVDLSIEPVITARHPVALTSLAASPWAPLVAIGGQRQILLYQTDTLELLGIIPFPEGIADSLHFSRNGSLLLAGGGIGAKSGKVIAFDVKSGKRVAEVGDEFDAVLASDITPDQTQVALGTPLKMLKIYNTSDGSLEQTIKKHTDWVQAVAYSPDGRFLASGDRAGGLWVWEAKTARELYNCTGHKEAVTAACFRGDSNILASASQDGTIKLWNMTDGSLAKTINAHPGGVLGIAFAHDGRLVSCGRDGQVKVWGPDGSAVKTFERFNDIALRAAFSFDGTRVVAGDYTGAIRVFTVADGKRVGDLTANPLSVAEQLTTFAQRLKDLQSASDKAAAELKSAQEGAASAAAELKKASEAESAAKQVVDEATAKATAANGGKALVDLRAKPEAELATVKKEIESLKSALAAKKSNADQIAASAQRNRERAQANPADKAQAQRARERTKEAADAKRAYDEAAKGVAAREARVKALTEALAKIPSDTKAGPKDSEALAAAKKALAKARTELESASKMVAQKSKAKESADQRLAAAQAQEKTTTQSLAGAKAQRTRLEALANKQPQKAADAH